MKYTWMVPKCRDATTLKTDIDEILSNFGSKFTFGFKQITYWRELMKQGQEARKCSSSCGFPEVGAKEFAVGDHGGQHFESLATLGFNEVTFAVFVSFR